METEGYKGAIKRYRGIQRETEGYREIQRDTEGYRGIQRNTMGYRGRVTYLLCSDTVPTGDYYPRYTREVQENKGKWRWMNERKTFQ